MPVRFVDWEGRDGWIGDDLSVSYGGPEDVAVQVESSLDERECHGRADEAVFQELMLDLSAYGSIQRVERVDKSENSDQKESL